MKPGPQPCLPEELRKAIAKAEKADKNGGRARNGRLSASPAKKRVKKASS